jgi:hypothetical protein
MSTGADIKTSVDALREELGSSCTCDGVSIGKCLTAELDPREARIAMGADYEDEQDLPWMKIDAAAGSGITMGSKITVTATGATWIVRYIKEPVASDVVLSQITYCVGATV